MKDIRNMGLRGFGKTALFHVLLFNVGAGFLFWLGTASPCVAAPSNNVIAVTVTVQESPASITLNWPAYSSAIAYTIYRQPWPAVSYATWVLVTNLTVSPGTLTGWTDTNVVPGTVYEYKIQRNNSIAYDYGYTMSAIRRPMVEDRGKVILVVDNTQAAALSSELARLQRDLAGDGWTVIRHDVERKNWDDSGWKEAVASTKALIVADYNADPTKVKAVFLFGHVPVPYSGDFAAASGHEYPPDGHSDHQGAWPADCYYGDMNGTWTDSSVNTSGSFPRFANVPGDGRFDQSIMPSAIDLQVGRVDLSSMPCFGKTETELLRQYLNKDHHYRMKWITTQPRGLIDDDTFLELGGESPAGDGWRNFGHMFGSTNVFVADWFPTLAVNSYQWACGVGPGNYTVCYGVGDSANYAATDTKVNFTTLFGSYFCDWDSTNNFLRAGLGTPTYTLSCSWAGRPHHFYHFMTLDATLGECIRISGNQPWYVSTYPTTLEYGQQDVHIALMGDPTLRMYVLAPPTGLTGAKSGGQAALSWAPSPESDLLGYHLYRGTSADGPFTRFTTSLVTGTNYTDVAAPGGDVYYLVRPVKFQVTNGGSYTNIGQGAMAVVGDFLNHAPVASNKNVALAGESVAITLTASDADGDPLTWWLGVRPQYGTVTGTIPNVVYIPGPDFAGADSFGFQVDDGKASSAMGTVSITSAPPVVLIVDYAMDDGTGLGIVDSGDLGHAGTLVNGPLWTSDSHSGSALWLDGADDYVATPNLLDHMAGRSLTLSIWFKARAAGVIVDEYGQGGVWHDAQVEYQGNGDVRIGVYPLSALTIGNVPTGEWHHAALVYNASSGLMQGYLDGVKAPGSVSGVKQWPSGDLSYRLGASDSTHLGDGSAFDGTVDDFRVYNKVLSDSEVLALASESGTAPMGTPVTWLENHVGPTNNYAAMELEDPDEDGLLNWEEYHAGTDPLSALSVFEVLGFKYLGANNELWWYGTTNSGVLSDFAVDMRTNLLSSSWTRVASNLSRANSGTNVWIHTNAPVDSSVFYRVVIP